MHGLGNLLAERRRSVDPQLGEGHCSRSQLGDVTGGKVSEDDIHPALLPAARDFIRQQ